MYYEYHLKDGCIELNEKANIASFEKIMGQVWDEEVKDMVTDYADVEVSYCVVKQGEMPEQPEDDYVPEPCYE